MLIKANHIFASLGAATLLIAGCQKATTLDGEPTTEVESTVTSMGGTPLPDVITFNDHVQPILSENCYHCHGPDSATRYPKKEPLRLDREEFAFEPREDSGIPTILAGDAENSAMMKRIVSTDADMVMPPPESHNQLDPEEIEIIRRWINEGAQYEEHWAFIAPVRPTVPDVNNGIVKNPIDAFVLEQLPKRNLEQNPEESPARLVRRIFFDVIGLPPTPEEVAGFIANHAQDPDKAINTLLDDLFERPTYGEHHGRHWLDVARYGDTHGIHIDNTRNIWPYRDWVVRAFNQNMPWNQFTVEQVAGDMLENATLDQKIASGFNRCLPTTGEGGAIADEYLAIYAQDRVDTTAAAWLGLTTNCASCHDHKFDPLSIKEVYELTAYFRNNTMSALDRNNANHAPVIFVPRMEDREQWDTINHQIADANKQLDTLELEAEDHFHKWLQEDPQSVSVPEPDSLHLPLTGFDGVITGKSQGKAISLPTTLEPKPGLAGNALEVTSDGFSLGALTAPEAKNPHTISFWVYFKGKPSGALISRMDMANDHRGWDIWFEEGHIGGHVIDRWPDNVAKAMTEQPLAAEKWNHVTLFYHPTKKHQPINITVNGEIAKRKVTHKGPVNDLTINADVPLRIGARDSNGTPEDGITGAQMAIQDFRFYNRTLSPDEVKLIAGSGLENYLLSLPAGQRTPANTKMLFDSYVLNHDPEINALKARVAELEKAQQDIHARGSNTLVMDEKADTKPTAHVLIRGQYSSPGEEVSPGVPAVLPELREDTPRNRIGLAKWLVREDNPLPARVTMNRVWGYLFGNGIVQSTTDFGVMGVRPTHRQLLDWLAVEFTGSGWDYQHMLRTMINSATYRQSANETADEREADPSNQWLARGPRYRLDAEQIRDLALASSGLLVRTMGGPPVKPYQPDGVWAAVAMPQSNTKNYKQDSGNALYRRSIYTFWKRTAPPASMEIFNAPSRETTCTSRDRTNTPLQAFVLMNDPQFVEASRQLAEEALVEHSEFADRLTFVTQRILARPFNEQEIVIAQATYDKLIDGYRADPESARQLIAVGETPTNASLPAHEFAAWTLLANSVYNLDEAITK